MIARWIAVSAAAGLSLAPIAASAAPAQPVVAASLAQAQRAASPAIVADTAAGDGIGVVGYALGAALLVGFGFLIADNADHQDAPDSN